MKIRGICIGRFVPALTAAVLMMAMLAGCRESNTGQAQRRW